MKPTHTNAESERERKKKRERERERERDMRNDEVQSTARRTERLEGEPKVLQILMP